MDGGSGRNDSRRQIRVLTTYSKNDYFVDGATQRGLMYEFGTIVLAVTVRFVEGMLYGVSAFDPARLAAITAVLALTAIVAGW